MDFLSRGPKMPVPPLLLLLLVVVVVVVVVVCVGKMGRARMASTSMGARGVPLVRHFHTPPPPREYTRPSPRKYSSCNLLAALQPTPPEPSLGRAVRAAMESRASSLLLLLLLLLLPLPTSLAAAVMPSSLRSQAPSTSMAAPCACGSSLPLLLLVLPYWEEESVLSSALMSPWGVPGRQNSLEKSSPRREFAAGESAGLPLTEAAEEEEEEGEAGGEEEEEEGERDTLLGAPPGAARPWLAGAAESVEAPPPASGPNPNRVPSSSTAMPATRAKWSTGGGRQCSVEFGEA